MILLDEKMEEKRWVEKEITRESRPSNSKNCIKKQKDIFHFGPQIEPMMLFAQKKIPLCCLVMRA